MGGIRAKVGETYGRWTLLTMHGSGWWQAQCECGVEKRVWISHLRSGTSKSCGRCGSKATHKQTNTSTYKSWGHMRQRCLNPNNYRFHQYGGRGINICVEWDSFEQFLSDMGERPKGHSLDRIDVDGDYTPDNCRWATPKEQMNNTRSNTRYEYGGKSLTLPQWSRETGVPYGRIQTRLQRGWPFEKALTLPPQQGIKCS